MIRSSLDYGFSPIWKGFKAFPDPAALEFGVISLAHDPGVQWRLEKGRFRFLFHSVGPTVFMNKIGMDKRPFVLKITREHGLQRTVMGRAHPRTYTVIHEKKTGSRD